MRDRPWSPRWIAPLAITVPALIPAEASGHVKWFCTITDVASPPARLANVLTPVFLSCFVGFLLLMFAGTFADGWVARVWAGVLSSGDRRDWLEELVIRAGICLFCVLLWDRAAEVPWGHAGTILTPELLDHDRLIGALQIAVAALVLRRESCGLAALALATLIGIGIARYGIFHMTDYVFFAGFVAYLGVTPLRPGPLRRWRLPLLVASLSFSLMWTAIEKFLYPQWAIQVFLQHQNLTLGFPVDTVVVIAGFVEFSVSFYLIVGRGLLRLDAVLMLVVFGGAYADFGLLDLTGHLPIYAILLAICLRGATPLHDALRLRSRGPAVNAAAVCGLYAATLSVMMAFYYALQLTAARA